MDSYNSETELRHCDFDRPPSWLLLSGPIHSHQHPLEWQEKTALRLQVFPSKPKHVRMQQRAEGLRWRPDESNRYELKGYCPELECSNAP